MLTAPEMTVLIGGLRVLNANVGRSRHGPRVPGNGVFTQRPEALTNDFFVNRSTSARSGRHPDAKDVFEGRDRATGKLKMGSRPAGAPAPPARTSQLATWRGAVPAR